MLTIENPSTFDWKNISLADCVEGNCFDSYFTLKLFNLFEEMLKDDPRWELYEKLISPVQDTFLDMEYEGLDVDPDTIQSVGRKIYLDNAAKEDELYRMDQVDTKYEFTKNQHVSDILFLDDNGFNLYPPVFTESGEAPSVNKECLDILLEQIETELANRVDAEEDI